MKAKYAGLFFLLSAVLAPVSWAQVKEVNLRVEGMT
jgi:hypothetical protein